MLEEERTGRPCITHGEAEKYVQKYKKLKVRKYLGKLENVRSIVLNFNLNE